MTQRTVVSAILAVLLGLGAAGFAGTAPPEDDLQTHGSATLRALSRDAQLLALEELRAWEAARRDATDFTTLPTGTEAMGPDPYRVVPIGSDRFAGILRGRDAVVVLDASLRELQRLPAPPAPTTLAVAGDRLYAGGMLSSELAAFRLEPDSLLAPESTTRIPGAITLRDLAAGPAGLLYAVDEATDRLLVLATAATGNGPGDRTGAEPPRHSMPQVLRSIPVPPGPFLVKRTGDHLIVDSLLGHALTVFALDPSGLPGAEPVAAIRHDGPIWGFDAIAAPEGLLIAAGGVEDKPLDRGGGFFGNIDSFVFLYAVVPGEGATRLDAVNLGDHGVVTPKALILRGGPGRARGEDGGCRVDVWGYGSGRRAALTWPDLRGDPVIEVFDASPGVAQAAAAGEGFVAANALLDRWERPGGAAPFARGIDDPDGAWRSRGALLGETLFFTTAMAPWNASDGAKSRFTCETCHFEGTVDGRTHYTGRGDVHATTKPLVGLFNNKPHFSRALDPDLTKMIDNEFRVAGAESGHEPWFALAAGEHPWLVPPLEPGETVPPDSLRRALAEFLITFTHAPTPFATGRDAWTPQERRGAEIFRERCAACHQARLVSDDPETRVPFEDWERLTFTPQAPIVWASERYAATGVEPYVHGEGARVPSLRRLYRKRPYFTNGAAATLEDLLLRVRFGYGGFLHDGGAGRPGLAPLGDEEREALLAFLRLL